MKLGYLRISGYKNLADTSLTFATSETPITIIGNNGTGKSNLIEALLHIFIGLYYDSPPAFDFDIRYSAHNKLVEVRNSRQDGNYTVTVDGLAWSHAQFIRRARNPQQMPPFPSQVFTYYSGTCDRVKNIIKKYNRSYLHKLKHQSDDLERQFVFSDISQAEWILLGLFAHRHHALLSDLEIDDLHGIKLTLQPPDTYVRDRDDPLYWGTEGGIKEFLAALDNAAEESYSPFEGSSGRGKHEARAYRLGTVHLEKLGAALERRGANLFSMLKALTAKNILINNEFDIVHRGSRTQYRPEFLSEGEKQLLCVIGGLTLAQNTECLVLLDEPDTHLNPTWAWRFNSLLKQALTSQQRTTSTTILATHDPIMISGLKREQVFMARRENGQLIYELPVRDPRGQGVANILVSEYFGLPSSLDEETQLLLDERLAISIKDLLTAEDKVRLKQLNQELGFITPGISERDPDYVAFLRQRHIQRQG